MFFKKNKYKYLVVHKSMKYKHVINVINNIYCKNDIYKYENLLLDCVYEINNKNNFKLLLFIVIYSKCCDILYFLKENNVNFNLERNGKNLLYYTTVLKQHDKSNLLISLYIKIQHKFSDTYISNALEFSLSSLKDIKYDNTLCCNHKFLLDLAYHGCDIIEYKNRIDEKYKLEKLESFHKKYEKELQENINSYNLWQRFKQLVYIVKEKSKQHKYEPIYLVFSIDLIIDKIKCYL